jgi:hypothetical protein
MGFWEKVLPGYKGYREREDSRNSDKLLREYLSKQLKEARNLFDEVKLALTKRGNLDLLDPAEKVTQVMSRVIDRLRYANYGFSGKWFGKDKIDVERLEKVHRFDEAMGEGVQKAAEQIRAMEPMGDAELKGALSEMVHAVRAMDEALNERENILRAVGGSQPDADET